LRANSPVAHDLVILIARREQKLNELRDELNQQYPKIAISFRRTDLASLTELNELLEWLDHERIDVDLLINNAGMGDSGAFATSNPIRNERMTLVNIVALTTLTRHLLPRMIARDAAAFERELLSRIPSDP